MHLDALADSADGLGAATRERALEIMREPTIGAFGATALLLDVVVKIAAVAAVAAGAGRAPGPWRPPTRWGRTAPLALGWALPYARSEGRERRCADGRRRRGLPGLGVGLGIGLAVAALGLRGIVLAAAAVVVAALVGLVARRRLGGVTGDVLGAAVELTTTLALVAAVATRLMLGPPPNGDATRLLLVRHAETDPAVRGRCYGRLEVGPLARRAAAGRGARGGAAEYPLAAVYSSPLSRALDTARAIAPAHGLEPAVDDDLREIDFGELEGLTYEEIEAERPEVFRAWMETPTSVRFPGGESFADLRGRVLRAVGAIRERHAGEAAAVVAHGGVVRVVLADALGLADGAVFRLDQAYGGLSVVDWVAECRSCAWSTPSDTRRMTPAATAVVLTVGNELVSGDVENTNGSWLARRLAALGRRGRAARRAARRDRGPGRRVPPRRAWTRTDVVFVTGGLGGTPDDITREAVAEAFGVDARREPELAEPLRARFGRATRRVRRALGATSRREPAAREPARRRARLRPRQRLRPAGAPEPRWRRCSRPSPTGFRGEPIGAWRRRYPTGEGQIVAVLEEATRAPSRA